LHAHAPTFWRSMPVPSRLGGSTEHYAAARTLGTVIAISTDRSPISRCQRSARVRRVQTLEPVDTVLLQRMSTIATSINRWFTGSARRPQQAANASNSGAFVCRRETA
jgi:hypothetical protein